MSNPTKIYCDNLSIIHVAKNPIFHAQTKHIDVHYHFVREQVLSGEVELMHVSTDRQIADIFTKPLGLDKLRHFSGELGLHHLDMLNLKWIKEEQEEEHEKERERSGGNHHGGSDRDAESEGKFDSELAEEAKEGSKGRNHREKLRATESGGDKVGIKT